jgi:V8-like Glu-specific endopeptidase
VGALSGCSDPASAATAELRSELIYGSDQRLDIFEVEDPTLRDVALRSSMALLPAGALVSKPDASYAVSAPTAGDFYNLCASESFREQPAAAVCSGILIAESLVLTAGHCAHRLACGEQAWAFGYVLTVQGVLPTLLEDDVYRCRSVLLSAHHTDTAGQRWDYAVIELSRAVKAPRKPISLSRSLPVAGERVSVIGYPAGVPAKVTGPATVLSVRDEQLDYFTLNSDTFDRSSGSGVFTESGELAGILVRGGQDFEYRESEGCWISRRVPEDVLPESAEHASYAAKAISSLCERAPAGATRCASSTSPAGGCATSGRASGARALGSSVAFLGALIYACTRRRRFRKE